MTPAIIRRHCVLAGMAAAFLAGPILLGQEAAPKTEPKAEAPAKETASPPKQEAPKEAAPAPAPAEVKPTETAPKAETAPEAPAAKPDKPEESAAAPPKPSEAPSEPPSCTGQINEVASLYEEKAAEIRKFTEKSKSRILPFVEMEGELQTRVQAIQKELESKQQDPQKNKKAIKNLQSDVNRLNKELKGAQGETRRQCGMVANQVSEMGKWHLEAVKGKFGQVQEGLRE